MAGLSLGARFSAQRSPHDTAVRHLARRDRAKVPPEARHSVAPLSRLSTVDIARAHVLRILLPVPRSQVAFVMEGLCFYFFHLDIRLTSAS
jgi:hypothetical protein